MFVDILDAIVCKPYLGGQPLADNNVPNQSQVPDRSTVWHLYSSAYTLPNNLYVTPSNLCDTKEPARVSNVFPPTHIYKLRTTGYLKRIGPRPSEFNLLIHLHVQTHPTHCITIFSKPQPRFEQANQANSKAGVAMLTTTRPVWSKLT